MLAINRSGTAAAIHCCLRLFWILEGSDWKNRLRLLTFVGLACPVRWVLFSSAFVWFQCNGVSFLVVCSV